MKVTDDMLMEMSCKLLDELRGESSRVGVCALLLVCISCMSGEYDEEDDDAADMARRIEESLRQFAEDEGLDDFALLELSLLSCAGTAHAAIEAILKEFRAATTLPDKELN